MLIIGAGANLARLLSTVYFVSHPHFRAGDDADASPQASEAGYRQADHPEGDDRSHAAPRLSSAS
jgi:hypothetical protein